MRTFSLPALMRMSLLVCIVSLSACSGGDDGAPAQGGACAVELGQCPNVCDFGSGVEFETCVAGEMTCGCGLECVDGACTPFAGENAGCSCGGEEGSADGELSPGGESDSDVAGPEAVDPSQSFYTMKVSLPDGTEIPIERDLTALRDTTFSYGSAHIAPAVAFAVTDTITWPQSVTITLDFGKIVGSAAFPIQTDGVGEYAFSDMPPAVEVYVELIQYKSLFGSKGQVTLTSWGQNTGDIIAGSFAGRLIQDTELEDKLWIDVEGTFQFVLPIKHNGQPG
mgnify:CR=1 FL=1